MKVGELTGVLALDASSFDRSLDRALDGAARKFSREGDAAGSGFGDGLDRESRRGTGRLSGLVRGLGGMLAGGAAIAGAAVGAALWTGITNALDAQASRGLLAAQLGLSDAEAAAAGQVAGDVYAGNFGDSLAGVHQAVGAVMSTLGDNLGAGGLQTATEQALTFAQVMGSDVETAVGLAGVAIQNGLARDAEHAFDLMTTASQQMPANMRAELIPAVEEYGTFLSDLGLTGEEAFGLLANASKDGQYGIDKTGDALKELTIRATDMSSTSKAAYEAAGLDAEDMAAKILAGGDTAKEGFDEIVDGLLGIEDPTARANAAIGLFGTPLEDLSVQQIPDFLRGLDTMGTSLGDVAGSTDRAAAQVAEGLGPRLEAAKRRGLMALTNFADGALQAFDQGGMSGLADHLAGQWDQAFPVIKAKARQLMTRAGEWIRTEGPGVARGIGDAIRTGAGAIIGAWPDYARMMGQLWSNLGRWIAETGIPALGDWLMAAGPALWQWIQDAYPEFARTMAGLWAQVGTWLVTEAVPFLLAKGAELWAAMFEWLWTEAVPALLRGLVSLIAALGTWYVGTAIPWMRTKAGEWFGTLVEMAITKGGEALAWLQGLPGQIAGWITGTAAPGLARLALQWFGKLREAAETKGAEAVAWLQGLPGRILAAVGDLGGVLLNAGRDLIQGLIDGVTEKIGSLRSKLGEVTDLIPDWKGPAERDRRLLTPAGQMIMDGLLGGIGSRETALRRQLGGYSSLITSAIDGAGAGLVRAPGVQVVGAGTVATSGPLGGASAVWLKVDRLVVQSPSGRVLAEELDMPTLAARIDRDRRGRP